MHFVLKMYIKLIKLEEYNWYNFYNLALHFYKNVTFLHVILLKRVLDVYIKVTFWVACSGLALIPGAPVWQLIAFLKGWVDSMRRI